MAEEVQDPRSHEERVRANDLLTLVLEFDEQVCREKFHIIYQSLFCFHIIIFSVQYFLFCFVSTLPNLQ